MRKKRSGCIVKDEFFGSIRQLDFRDDLILITDSQDVKAIKDHFGNAPAANYDGFFVKIGPGVYEEVYGFDGVVPSLDKSVFKITMKCR